jgi:hypothetical protein
MGPWREDLGESFDAARERVTHYGRSFRKLLRERPAAALVLALGVGYLVGRVFRR